MPRGGVDKNKTEQQKRNAARAKAVARKPSRPNPKLRDAPKPQPRPAPPDILRGPYQAPNRPMVPTAPRPMPVVRIEAERQPRPQTPRIAPTIVGPRPRPVAAPVPEPRPRPAAPGPFVPPARTPQQIELERLRGWRGYDQPFVGEHALSQGWGEHPDVYKKGGWAGHAGLDWGLETGTPIQTLGPGKVVAAVENPEKTGYGTYVIVEHPNGDQTLYGHMSELNVQEGDEVGYGSILGKSGDTGFSFNASGTGSFPHLHLGYKPATGGDAAYGNWADPTSILGQYEGAGALPVPQVATGVPALTGQQGVTPTVAAPQTPLPATTPDLSDVASWRKYQYRTATRNAERDAAAEELKQAQAETENPLLDAWYGVGRGLNAARRAGGNFWDWYQAGTDLVGREPNNNLWGVPYRLKEDGTAEWIPPWTYRWNDPENRNPIPFTNPVIGPQPQNADVQTMPFGPFSQALARGFLASQSGTSAERRREFAQSFNASTNAYLQAQALVNEIDDPDARVDAEIGLLAGATIATAGELAGESLTGTPVKGALPAVKAIIGQEQTVAGLRSKAARLLEQGNFVEAGKLLAQADHYETLTPAQLTDEYTDLLGSLFVDMVFDPGSLLGGVASVVGSIADARRGARALAPAMGNLAMQADDALRRAAALKQAAGIVDDVTAAARAVDIRKVAGATAQEVASTSRIPFVKWFTLTPESYAKIRTGEVFHYASALINKLAGSGEVTAGDVLKVLATAANDPMKLTRGMAASEFAGPAARALSGQNPNQVIRWGASTAVPDNLKQILPILAYALPDISKFKSLQNVNDVVDMAKFGQEFDDAIYDAARRLYGRSSLIQAPVGTDVRNGMKVVDAGNGESAIVFMNKAGDIISQTAPMTTKEAKTLKAQYVKAAKAPGSALAGPFKAVAGAQRAIMTDFFLGLSPRNWILNAAAAQIGMLIERQSTLGVPLKGIDAYVQQKLGASMGNRRVYEGLMGATSGLGGGAHWTDAFPNNPLLQAWGRVAKKSLGIPYSRTELPGGVGMGEQNLYTRAFYSVLKRVVDRNWEWMTERMLSDDLAQLGIDPRYAQRLIQAVQEAGRNGNEQTIVDALRQTITGPAAPHTVASLNVPAGLLSPDAEKALNQLMAEHPIGWEQQALDIFKSEMQPHFETLAQAPPDYQVEEWIKATGVQDTDTVYSAIYEAAIGQGAPKPQAAQRAAEVSAAVNAPYDSVIKGVITDLRNMPANPAVAQQLVGGWAELRRLTNEMRAAIDKSSQEMFAMRRNPIQARGAWAHKEAATRAAVDKFVAARAEWLVRWRDNIQRAAAGEVLPDSQDWRSLLTEYMTYDEAATQFVRGLEAGHGGTQQYKDIIDAGRAYVDASYVRLFEAVRLNGTADALDILYSAGLQASRIYAATVGGVDKAYAAAQAKKIPWEQFYTIRNDLWRKARDAEVLTNEYALRYIVADAMQKAGAATTFNGLTLVGPAGNGKWIARKPGEFAPQFLDEAAIPPEVLASWRRKMNPQTQAQSIDEAVAEIGRVTGTDTVTQPAPPVRRRVVVPGEGEGVVVGEMDSQLGGAEYIVQLDDGRHVKIPRSTAQDATPPPVAATQPEIVSPAPSAIEVGRQYPGPKPPGPAPQGYVWDSNAQDVVDLRRPPPTRVWWLKPRAPEPPGEPGVNDPRYFAQKLSPLPSTTAPASAPSMQPDAVAQRMAEAHASIPTPGGVRDATPEIDARIQSVMDAAAASGMQNATVPVRVVNSINAHAGEIGLERRIGDLSELTPEEAALVQAYYAKRSASVAEAVQEAAPTVERGGQTTMFGGTSEDLPLFSGAAPRTQAAQPFAPQDVQRQESLLDMRPQMGAAEPSYAPAQAATPPRVLGPQDVQTPAGKATIIGAEERGGKAFYIVRTESGATYSFLPGNVTIDGKPAPEILLSEGVTKQWEDRVNQWAWDTDPGARADTRAQMQDMWRTYAQGEWGLPPLDQLYRRYRQYGLPEELRNVTVKKQARTKKGKRYGAVTEERQHWEDFLGNENPLNLHSTDDVARFLDDYGETSKAAGKRAAEAAGPEPQRAGYEGQKYLGWSKEDIIEDNRQLFLDNGMTAQEIADLSNAPNEYILNLLSLMKPLGMDDSLRYYEGGNLGIIYDPVSFQMFVNLSNWTRKSGGKQTQTVGDLATHQVTTLLDAQREFFAAMRRGPDSIPNTLTPQQRQAVLDLIYNRVLPAYDNLLGEAAEAGRRGADRTMLNYDKRRGFDEIMSILSPYHYYWSRAPLNWAMRLARHPGALGLIADWMNTWQRTAEQQGEYYDPQRVEGKIQLGDTGVWIGNYLDRVLPFAGLMGNPFVDEEVAQSSGESAYLWMKQQGIPLWGPLGEFAIALMLDSATPRPEGTAPRYKDYGLADLLGPLGREAAALGQAITGNIMPWWVSGDQYRTGVAGRHLTTQGEGTPSQQMWGLDVLQQGQRGLEPLPEQPEGVGQLAEQAVRGVGWQDALVAGIQGALGVPNNIYTPEEAKMRELQAARRALGYNEETGLGSAAAVEGFDEQTGNITYPFARYTDLYPQTTLEPEERERLGITAARRDRGEELEPLYAQQTAELDKAAKALIAQMQSGAIKPSAAKQQIGAIYDKYEPLIQAIKDKYPSVPEGKTRTMPPVNGTAVQMDDYGGTYANMNPEEAQARALADAEEWAKKVTEKQIGEYPAYNPDWTSAEKEKWTKSRDAWEAARLENLTTILGSPALMETLTYQTGLEEGREPPAGVQDVGALPPAEAAATARELIDTKGSTPILTEFYAIADKIAEERAAANGAAYQARLNNVNTRMGKETAALLDAYFELPKGAAREQYRIEHPEIRLATIAAYNPQQYDAMVKLFGADAVKAWGYTPQWVKDNADQDAARERYFAEHPETFAVGAWVYGRPKGDTTKAEDAYDFGKDYQYAIETWGENVWNVATQYRATDKAGRRGLYRQHAWLDAFWDWWYENNPDTEKTGKAYSYGSGGVLRGGGYGGATYSNIGSGGAYLPQIYPPNTNTRHVEYNDNPWAQMIEPLRRWRPNTQGGANIRNVQMARLRNWR